MSTAINQQMIQFEGDKFTPIVSAQLTRSN